MLPAVLGLQDALRIFHERGFDLLVAEANVAAAQGDLTIAGAVANPGVSLAAGRNFNCAASQDCTVVSYGVVLSDNAAVSDLVSGKRGLRKTVAAAGLEASRRSRDDVRRTLDFQVKQVFYQALLAQAQLETAQQTRDSNRRTRELNERRYALGAISEGDLAKIQVAELEAEQAVDQARQGLRAAKLALAFWLGFRTLVPDFEMDRKELDFAVPRRIAEATPQSLLKDALEHRPDFGAQMQQERRAEAALSLARRNRIPDVGLSVAYSANGSGDSNISPPNTSLGVSFSLPVFYFQGGEIAKAQADLDAERTLRRKSEAQVVSDVETAWAQVAAARSLVERMQSILLERAAKALEIARIQYEKGAASLLDLLDAQRTYTATRLEYGQDLAGYRIAVAQLEEAVAMELTP